MKYANLLTLCVAAFASTSQAVVIQMNDYENESAAGFGIQPGNMDFTDGGGDHVGQSGLGIADANPRSGTYSYAINNQTAANGNGWGGTWSGSSSLGGNGSNVTDQATAVANGSSAAPLSYVNIQEGSVFTASAWFATDANNPLTGGTVNAHVRLEFYNGANAEPIGRQFSNNFTAADLTTDYQQSTVSYTFTAADAALGIERVVAVIGTDGHGDGNGTGVIYADDFLFEVDDASFVTVVPEPSSALLGLLGVLGLTARRRR